MEEGERIKETLNTFIKSVHTHCEKKLRDDKSLSIFLVRKQFVHLIQNIEPSCTLFGNVCREMLSEIISKFTEVAGMKVKNCEKRASFSIQCSRVLLYVEKTNNWKEIRDAFAATLEEKERHEVYLHASVVLNVTYWTIYEKFHEMVLQIKEARNSFSFFQTNKHILFLDTVRAIISRRNLARVLSTYRRFLTLCFPPK